jgi:hypothetical protein
VGQEFEDTDHDEREDQEWAPRPPPITNVFRGLDALLEVLRQPFPPPVGPVDDIRETDGIAPWALSNNEEEEYDDYGYEDNDEAGWEPPVFGWAPVPVDIDALLSGLQSVSDGEDDFDEDELSIEAEDEETGGIITASEGVPFPWGGGGGGQHEPPNERHEDGGHDDEG